MILRSSHGLVKALPLQSLTPEVAPKDRAKGRAKDVCLFLARVIDCTLWCTVVQAEGIKIKENLLQRNIYSTSHSKCEPRGSHVATAHTAHQRLQHRTRYVTSITQEEWQ